MAVIAIDSYSYLIGEVQGKEVGLLPASDLDGERDADGESEGHGGSQCAVVRHLALHTVLEHRAKSPAPYGRLIFKPMVQAMRAILPTNLNARYVTYFT